MLFLSVLTSQPSSLKNFNVSSFFSILSTSHPTCKALSVEPAILGMFTSSPSSVNQVFLPSTCYQFCPWNLFTLDLNFVQLERYFLSCNPGTTQNSRYPTDTRESAPCMKGKQNPGYYMFASGYFIYCLCHDLRQTSLFMDFLVNVVFPFRYDFPPMQFFLKKHPSLLYCLSLLIKIFCLQVSSRELCMVPWQCVGCTVSRILFSFLAASSFSPET